jgi:hypothetical protein
MDYSIYSGYSIGTTFFYDKDYDDIMNYHDTKDVVVFFDGSYKYFK